MSERFRLPGAAEPVIEACWHLQGEAHRTTAVASSRKRPMSRHARPETLHAVNESFLKSRFGFPEYMSDGVAQQCINHI
jgi:hypothetical protein